MDNHENQGSSATLIAVTLTSVVSALVARGLSSWFGLVASVAIGAVVGLVARWLIYRARLRADLDAHGQS